ncbi:class I SAM-dependent methyltransferase [Vibrio sp. F74]|uniref:class I SAM-dependent methyltransferase n=1 Tax=Vibrio sp. F74 TaxID=700020 RepID=UPI0035F539E9
MFLEKCTLKDSLMDIPCGTGRMFPTVTSVGFNRIYGADYSSEMLSVCKLNPLSKKITLSNQDIYNITFSDRYFSVILSSRFLFHCDDQERLFSEFERLIVPKGYLIFDSLNWSPRTWTKLLSKQLGGKIYTNDTNSINELAQAHGFKVICTQSILIFPSVVYNFIPGFLMRPLKWLESVWPSAFKTKQIWMLKKI